MASRAGDVEAHQAPHHALDKAGQPDRMTPEGVPVSTLIPVNMSVQEVHAAASLAPGTAVPDAQQRQAALDQLHGFHVSRSWFRG
jgi:hypothetical protein